MCGDTGVDFNVVCLGRQERTCRVLCVGRQVWTCRVLCVGEICGVVGY